MADNKKISELPLAASVNNTDFTVLVDGNNSTNKRATVAQILAAGTIGGTVTSVGVTGANGIAVSGSPITTSGTIALGLGNITPTSVVASGTITGSNVSGTNTGDQTIQLVGDVEANPSFGTLNTSISNGAVTNTKLANAPGQTLKGRISAGTGAVSDLTPAQAASILPEVIGDAGSGGTKGLVPAPGAGDAAAKKFLRADGTWQPPAINDLLPVQSGQNGKVLKSDGTNVSWQADSGGSGTVTSVSIANGTDISVSGSPITTSGTITIGLTNTGAVAGSYGSASSVPSLVVDAKGRIGSVTNTPIAINAGAVSGLAAVATTGAYASLTGTPSLGTISSQNSTAVSITGGTITGITDLAVADGGTGASNAADARNNLGLGTISTQAANSVSITGGTMANVQVTGLPVPTGADWAATKAYVDSVAIGVTHVKTPVVAATTTNITLSGEQTIDGVAVVAGNRVLVKNQSAPAENGIYDCAVGAWSRSSDSNTPAELQAGAYVVVTGGTVNNGDGYILTTAPVILGTDPVEFTLFINSVGGVSSVNASGGTTGLSFSGGPITSSGTLTLGGTLALASGGTGATDAPTARSNLGLGTIATQNSNSVSITGGTITGITDLAVADGGTGVSTTPTSGQLLIGNGTGYTVANLTAGSGVTITNGAGTITLATTATQTADKVIAIVTNDESVAITKGQVVYAFAATGNRMSVKLASNTSEATSARTIGFVYDASIAAGGTGQIINIGEIDGLNLGSYSEGDPLYLAATAGDFTKTKPVAPAHLVFLGVVERANSGNGEIYVKIENGSELDENADVLITGTPVAGSLIIRDATAALWKNATLSAGTNIAVSNGDAAITVGLTGIVSSANGGTGNGFTKFTGPTTSEKTFTLPNSSETLLYAGGPLGTPSSGTLTNATDLPIATGVSGLGTGVTAALATNVGSAGAFVVNGGALGTPSSGTVTNLTGTASININGTVGATTPSTGAFTNLSASGTFALTGDTVQLTEGGTGASDAGTARTNLGLGTVATKAAPSGTSAQLLANDGSGGFANVTVGSGLTLSAGTLSATGGGSGTVTTVSVVSANGFAGTVANATTTPAITLSTSVTGLLKGNGTAISAASAGTDYAAATTGSNLLAGNGSGGFTNVSTLTGLTYSAGSLAVTWASPGAIGSTTANTGAFTTLSASGTTTLSGIARLKSAGGILEGWYDSTPSSAYQIESAASGVAKINVYNGSSWTYGVAAISPTGLSVTGALSATGNVGMGTTSVTEITSGARTVEIYGGSGGGGSFLHITNSTTGQASLDGLVIGYSGGSSDALIIQRENAPMIFRTNNTERMRIDSSGNLGIGTTSPSYPLQVSGSPSGDSQSFARFGGTWTASANSQSFYNTLCGGTVASQTYTGLTYYGFYANTPGLTGTGTIATSYQLYLATGPTATTKYGIYQSGTDKNYFGGDTGIGTDSPSTTLHVFTANSTKGIRIQRFAGNYYSELRHTTSPEGLAFLVGDGTTVSEKMRITGSGNVIAGASAALATTATDGFLYVPTCAGTPTGTPTTVTGMAPIVVNTTNNKLYFYSGGAWRDAGP